ncbi:MAG: endolytic transglycosylase MltG [Oscillospiraceae bacterium]|nr:endolytic transglycosylase MltG [Oscillospiraceae bacterium]
MLTEDSPYNTNLNHGLPPTPICNPSLAAIQAALEPDETNDLFFYFDKENGFSRFFTNYNDFLIFVETQREQEQNG